MRRTLNYSYLAKTISNNTNLTRAWQGIQTKNKKLFSITKIFTGAMLK
jgi:hypothetical protein